MGCCSWTFETSANEFIHNVHGWKLYFNIPYNDGWHVDSEAS